MAFWCGLSGKYCGPHLKHDCPFKCVPHYAHMRTNTAEFLLIWFNNLQTIAHRLLKNHSFHLYINAIRLLGLTILQQSLGSLN